MALSPSQVYTLARQAGFDPGQATIMVAIAGGESGWNPEAVGDVGIQDATWGPSIGLWQVRSLKAETGKGTARDATRLKDPAFNARAAREVYRQQGYGAWSVYSSGKYRSYMGQAGRATETDVSNLPGVPGAIAADLVGGIGDALPDVPNPADAVARAMDGLWGQLVPLATKGIVVSAGLALLVIGVTVTAWPTANRVRESVPEPKELLT